MSVDNFIPQFWSSKLMYMLQKELVFGSCCNRDYEGEIANQGDTVRINQIGKVATGNYTKNSTSVSPETLVSTQATLTISQSKYFAFKVDDVDKAQTGANLLAGGMMEAAYAMRDVTDQFIASLYSKAGSISSTTAINSTNILKALLSAGQTLDEYNVPKQGRWAVLPPWMITALVIAKLLVENTTNDAWTNGTVGRVAGFDIKQSNNVYNSNGTYYPMFGTNKAISFADQINQVEAYRPEAGFSDAVKGLHLYGAEVIYPEALVVVTATIGVEP